MKHVSDLEEPWGYVHDDPRINDIEEPNYTLTLYYINGVAHYVESYGEPREDGSRHATLAVWRPF